MKIALKTMLIIPLFFSCSSDEEQTNNSEKPQSEKKKIDITYSKFTDERDGVTYKTANIGGVVWMAENLKFHNFVSLKGWGLEKVDKKLTQARISQGTDEFLEYYPNYYDKLSAQLACPQGWRLPTAEDYKNMFSELDNRYGDLFAKVPYGKKCYNEAAENKLGMNVHTGQGSYAERCDDFTASYVMDDNKAVIITGPNIYGTEINEPHFYEGSNRTVCVRCIQNQKNAPVIYQRTGILKDVKFSETDSTSIILEDENRMGFTMFYNGNIADLSNLVNLDKLGKYESGEYLTDKRRLYNRGVESVVNKDYVDKTLEIFWTPSYNEIGEAFPSIVKITIDGQALASMMNTEKEVKESTINSLPSDTTHQE